MKLLKLIQPLGTVLVTTAFLMPAAWAQQDAWSESYRLEYAGKYAEAQAPIEPLAVRQPNNEFAIMRTAWLLHLQGKYAEAEKRYMKAAEVNPRSLEASLGMMLPQMAQYRWADAIKTGRKILTDSPWDYNAHVRIMVCEEAMSRWDDLAKHAAEVSTRYPTDATVLVYWARAQAALHNTRKAKELYGQVLERFPAHVEATKFIKNNP
jgi:tetratricopeptide (TPR) repeat protein